MDADDNPHQLPDPTKRFQVYALVRGADVRIEVVDMLERSGVAMPMEDAPVVAEDITREAQRILGTVRDVIEGVKSEEALFKLGFRQDAILAALEGLAPEDEQEPDQPWPEETTNLRWRIVEIMNAPSHAIRDRQALALRLTSEMALFEAGAKRVNADNLFRTFEEGVVLGLGMAAVLFFGTAEGRRMLNRALTMSEDL
jgi:hypothetical protein